MCLRITNFIPNEYHKSIYDIDFDKLYVLGCRIILTDLDNTLISYQETLPDEKLLAWKKRLEQIGYQIIVISNSRYPRVSKFAHAFDNVTFQPFATKPLKRGYKKALKKIKKKVNPNQVIFIGDQLMTDVFGANRCKMYTILVDAIKRKTEKRITKFNRIFEKKILRRIRRKYSSLYEKSLKNYAEEHYGL